MQPLILHFDFLLPWILIASWNILLEKTGKGSYSDSNVNDDGWSCWTTSSLNGFISVEPAKKNCLCGAWFFRKWLLLDLLQEMIFCCAKIQILLMKISRFSLTWILLWAIIQMMCQAARKRNFWSLSCLMQIYCYQYHWHHDRLLCNKSFICCSSSRPSTQPLFMSCLSCFNFLCCPI